MANDIFFMGHVMWLYRNNWLKRLVLILFIFSYSINSYAFLSKYWSSVVLRFHTKDFSSNEEKNGNVTTDCRLTGAKETDGYPNMPRTYARVSFGWNSMIIDYGKDIEEFAGFDGQFVYAERFPFSDKLTSHQNQKIQSLIKKALSENKCDIAQGLADSLTDPDVRDGYVGFQNGDDKCVIANNGSTHCNWQSPATHCDSNGENCHIVVGDDKEGTFEDYLNTKEKATQNSDNSTPPSSPPSSNSGGSSGTGSGDSGTGSGNSSGSSSTGGSNQTGNNPSQGNNQGGISVGTGSGSGEGDGEGDGKSDFNKPGIDEFNLKSAFTALKERFDDYIPNLSLPAGSCPTFTVPIFNTVKDIDAHCKIFDQHGSKLSAVFSLIWSFLALRILLSA
ncbi:hypothetical protein NMU88_00840 [Pasteurella multocida]|nr:hypothetical protein [Pasteurella multocida]MDY0485038.1 hypothetical protein [Pasteurella multocida]MDY0537127.1 hypothetical protein [Pasteurella multocida]